jgi:hypothetical protein
LGVSSSDFVFLGLPRGFFEAFSEFFRGLPRGRFGFSILGCFRGLPRGRFGFSTLGCFRGLPRGRFGFSTLGCFRGLPRGRFGFSTLGCFRGLPRGRFGLIAVVLALRGRPRFLVPDFLTGVLFNEIPAFFNTAFAILSFSLMSLEGLPFFLGANQYFLAVLTLIVLISRFLIGFLALDFDFDF